VIRVALGARQSRSLPRSLTSSRWAARSRRALQSIFAVCRYIEADSHSRVPFGFQPGSASAFARRQLCRRASFLVSQFAGLSWARRDRPKQISRLFANESTCSVNDSQSKLVRSLFWTIVSSRLLTSAELAIFVERFRIDPRCVRFRLQVARPLRSALRSIRDRRIVWEFRRWDSLFDPRDVALSDHFSRAAMRALVALADASVTLADGGHRQLADGIVTLGLTYCPFADGWSRCRGFVTLADGFVTLAGGMHASPAAYVTLAGGYVQGSRRLCSRWPRVSFAGGGDSSQCVVFATSSRSS